jgi:hypothetical protein
MVRKIIDHSLTHIHSGNKHEMFTDSVILALFEAADFNILKPTVHVMHQQFNIQHFYALPTVYLCVLYLYENKQRLVPLKA